MVASARGGQVEREAIDRVMTVRTLLPLLLLLAVSWSGATPESVSTKPKHPAPHQPTHAAASGKAHRANSHVRHVKTRRKPRSARSIARSRKLQRAFVASTQLRPMAQELATMRSPAAYAGVTAYARAHTGEAASAAYLALGHAYLLDRRYPDAAASFQKANALGKTMDDYADFLAAQALMESGKLSNAETLLTGFAAKYPESIFVGRLPVMIANLSLDQ
ncbi:MAG: soluble lytic murein transglycosylase, partial [Acidobacteriaceae bacterium]|nr:soluble lytic murein transglycosylase [Acidobacteriaceae bacterium]